MGDVRGEHLLPFITNSKINICNESDNWCAETLCDFYGMISVALRMVFKEIVQIMIHAITSKPRSIVEDTIESREVPSTVRKS